MTQPGASETVLTPRRAGVVLGVLLSAQFMNNVDTAIVNVAAPDITVRLGATGAQIQMIVSGYVLAYAVLLVTGARLGEMWGHRRMFLLGTAVFTLASLACGLAATPTTLIVARLVQGVGAALMVPQVLTGIQLHFSGPSRVRALSLYAVALSGGAVAGQVLGGVLVSADLAGSGWRSIFLINLPVGIALLVAAVVMLPRDVVRGGRRLDVAGVAVLSASVLALVLPLVVGRDEGWPVWTWLCLLAVPFLVAAFVAVERRVAARGGSPLVNLPVVARPVVAWGLLAQACAQAGYFAVLLTLALYLQEGLGTSALYSGLALLSWVIAFGAAGFALRRLRPDVATRVSPIGHGVLALAYAAITVTMLAGDTNGVLLIALLGVGGLGLGLGVNSMIARVTSSVPRRFAADISGVHSTVLQIAAVLGVAIFGAVYLAAVPAPGPVASTHGFAVVTGALTVTALLGALAAWRSVRRPVTADVEAPDVEAPVGRSTDGLRAAGRPR